MSNHISLLISGGNGPDECNQAVAGILQRMLEEAERLGISVDIDPQPAKIGLKSAVLVLHGTGLNEFTGRWVGTLCWRAKSTLRRQHKRANWFVGVFELAKSEDCPRTIRPQDVTFQSFRAGGPGGQHQNTTDSAVRATHRPTGLTAVAREMRSQHRNKALALERLQALRNAVTAATEQSGKDARHRMHHAIARGNPLRVFSGPDFQGDGAS